MFVAAIFSVSVWLQYSYDARFFVCFAVVFFLFCFLLFMVTTHDLT